ncbi:signal peptidase II [Spiroplasma tabanidicola]|uniref:Lipoprotein signal peptidase n=1 Tax=Spiroplasma tabanidicola TaxID=324079 RepID=A0A6I6C5K8_9MOLU|nr:signal peptidase II [Spiroplasma tabanidicola]QGS52137.1 lipoprotein signal peptidase [Spiroplasma tabanidicola]
MEIIENIKLFFKNHNYAWRYKLIWCLPFLILLASFDWITKIIVSSKMEYLAQPTAFIPGLLKFQYIINPGAALSMNAGKPSVAIALAALVTIALIIVWIFCYPKFWTQSVNLMLAGSLANLLGRAWAPTIPQNAGKDGGIKGGVVDFLQWDFDFFGLTDYTFNIADVYVNVAVGLLVIALIIFIVQEIILGFYKKQGDLYDLYQNFKEDLKLLESKYLQSVKKQPIKVQFKMFQDYLANGKKIRSDWKQTKMDFKNKNSKENSN